MLCKLRISGPSENTRKKTNLDRCDNNAIKTDGNMYVLNKDIIVFDFMYA